MAFLPPAPLRLTASPAPPSFRRPPTCSATGPKPGLNLLSRVPTAPLSAAIATARAGWTFAWRVMMAELAPSDASGAYVRPSSLAPSSATLPADATIYTGAACPWCHRVVLAAALLASPVSFTPLTAGDDGLWALPSGEKLRAVYRALGASGRATAPLLVGADALLSNESADILRIFGEAAGRVALAPGVAAHMRPPGALGADVDALCDALGADLNNGVYRAGFATTQAAYAAAEDRVVACLDACEARLRASRFLCAPDVVTEADVRLFATAVRFDAVYARMFRCGRKTIGAHFPAIAGWMRDFARLRGVKETVDVGAAVESYYGKLFMLNPGGVVPRTPEFCWEGGEDRVGLGL